MKLLRTKVILLMFLVCYAAPIAMAQVTKGDIRELLLAQGMDNVNQRAEKLFGEYYSSHRVTGGDWTKSLGESALSGVCMGLNQSRAAGYTNISWMPSFLKSWYNNSFSSDNVYSKSLTWQKVWRELDYASDRMAYEGLRNLFKDNTLKAAAVQFIVKNIAGFMVRNEMKSGRLL